MAEKITTTIPNRTPQREQTAQLPPPTPSLSTLHVPSSPQKAEQRKTDSANSSADISAYDVKSGDTLFGIAKKFGMAVDDLKKLNPEVNPKKMEIGDRVIVKAPAERPAPPANSSSYYIQPGDTFDKLAKHYGVPTKAILGLNPNVEPGKLVEGQRIIVPASATPTATQAAPVSQSPPAAINTTAAFKVLDDYRKQVEGEGRTWVVSQRSRPNPEAVKAINELLNAAGARPPLSGSVFSERTFEAMKSFQSANGLNPDGKFGGEVLDAFRYALKPVRSEKEYISISTRQNNDGLDTIRKGETVLRWDSSFDGKNADREAYLAAPKDPVRVAMVRNLQALLNDAGAWPTVEPSGIFDAQTKKAVMNFQKSQKLSPDGSVGESTIKALDASREKYIFALKRVLGEEGGASNHKNDRGGLTFKGVTQGTYDSWRDRHHLAAQPVTEMNPLEARALYRELYWLKAYCDQCPKKIATVVFDCAVNCGVGTARNHLNQACEKANLQIGDLKSVDPKQLKELGMSLIELRRNHHSNIIKNDSSQKDFQRGWTNRIDRLANLVATIQDPAST